MEYIYARVPEWPRGQAAGVETQEGNDRWTPALPGFKSRPGLHIYFSEPFSFIHHRVYYGLRVFFKWMTSLGDRIGRLRRDPLLRSFDDFLIREYDLGKNRRLKYLYSIRKIVEKFGEPNSNNYKDIVTWIKKSFKGYTRRDYLLTLKYFLRFRGVDTSFKVTPKKSEIKKLRPTQLLTPSEVKRLVDASDDLMIRVMILLLWETGIRIGELLNIRKEDIEETEYGFLIRVSGKTGVRAVPVIMSAPQLAQYLNSVGQGKLFNISYDHFRYVLKKLAEKAGIKKRIYPHLFRHSRATLLAKKRVGEHIMRQYFGWDEDSEMPSIYVHLAASDVEDAILELYEYEGKKVGRESIPCWRCGHQNLPGSRYCNRCGSPLDQSRVAIQEIKMQRLFELLERLRDLRGKLP